ncbi:MAG TPA: hypothetical protein VJR50_04330 [Mycobacterium sp.]|nr:hypothetical protein [Mycobacterium sp.]
MSSPTSTTLRRLSAATFTMAAFAVGPIATAMAAPEWDIDAYDKCMAKTVRDPATCCLMSGGNISPDDPNVCLAPAALEQETGAQETGPTRPALPPEGRAVMPGQAVG